MIGILMSYKIMIFQKLLEIFKYYVTSGPSGASHFAISCDLWGEDSGVYN